MGVSENVSTKRQSEKGDTPTGSVTVWSNCGNAACLMPLQTIRSLSNMFSAFHGFVNM